jgi:hypothetical protein
MEAKYQSGRYVHPSMLSPLTSDMDADILIKYGNTREQIVANEFTYQDLHLPVLLTACGSDEVAYETDGAGDFTAAFLKTLIQYGVDRVTYWDCICRLPILQKYV